jgi:hypothetical protein
MKTMKRFSTLCCAIALVFALAACGTSEASVADILAAADKKVSEAKSMETDETMDTDMVMTMQGQSTTMKTNTVMNIVMFNDPMKMKVNMTMNLDMGELSAGTPMEPMKMDMYIAGEDSNYKMYANDGTGWTSQAVDMSSIKQYDPKTIMEMCLKSADSSVKDKEETINDVKATKYTGVIKGDAQEEVVKSSGMLDNMSSLGIDLEGIDWKTLYSEMGDMPISIWINEEGYPVRFEMDMKDLFNKVYQKLIEQMGEEAAGAQISCTKVLVSMNCKNYDKATDFEIPAEAMK